MALADRTRLGDCRAGIDRLEQALDVRKCGERIAVAVDGSKAVWEPDTAVVFVGRTASACEGSSAAICCGYMNFFTSHTTAAAWASAHPEIIGGILSQGRALEVGRQIFGQLLH